MSLKILKHPTIDCPPSIPSHVKMLYPPILQPHSSIPRRPLVRFGITPISHTTHQVKQSRKERRAVSTLSETAPSAFCSKFCFSSSYHFRAD